MTPAEEASVPPGIAPGTAGDASAPRFRAGVRRSSAGFDAELRG